MGDNGFKDNPTNAGNLQRPSQVQSGNGREEIWKDLPRSYLVDFGTSEKGRPTLVHNEHLQAGEDGCFSNTQTDCSEISQSDIEREQLELYGGGCRNCD